MAKSRVPSPQSTISFKPVKVKGRTYKVGDTILIPATITRTGRNTFDTVDTVTIQLEGTDVKVTKSAEILLGRDN